MNLLKPSFCLYTFSDHSIESTEILPHGVVKKVEPNSDLCKLEATATSEPAIRGRDNQETGFSNPLTCKMGHSEMPV